MITLNKMAGDIYLLTVDGRNEMAKKMNAKADSDISNQESATGILSNMKSAYLAKPAVLLTGMDNMSTHLALHPILKMLHGQLHNDTRSINLLTQNKYYVAPQIINRKSGQKPQSLAQSEQQSFSHDQSNILKDFVK